MASFILSVKNYSKPLQLPKLTQARKLIQAIQFFLLYSLKNIYYMNFGILDSTQNQFSKWNGDVNFIWHQYKNTHKSDTNSTPVQPKYKFGTKFEIKINEKFRIISSVWCYNPSIDTYSWNRLNNWYENWYQLLQLITYHFGANGLVGTDFETDNIWMVFGGWYNLNHFATQMDLTLAHSKGIFSLKVYSHYQPSSHSFDSSDSKNVFHLDYGEWGQWQRHIDTST